MENLTKDKKFFVMNSLLREGESSLSGPCNKFKLSRKDVIKFISDMLSLQAKESMKALPNTSKFCIAIPTGMVSN